MFLCSAGAGTRPKCLKPPSEVATAETADQKMSEIQALYRAQQFGTLHAWSYRQYPVE